MMHPRVWEASGHVDSFTDPMVDCKECNARFRSDHIDLDAACPNCGKKDTFTEPRQFNMMFSTHLGPVAESGSIVYLRPETAQGIFTNFKNVVQTSRVKIPFGIAQVGKAFRNEITTKNFIKLRLFAQSTAPVSTAIMLVRLIYLLHLWMIDA